jgi:glycosyltransferase involved in cell wall biosynthesis
MEMLAGSGVDVHVFAYPVNAEAPFKFDGLDAQCQYYLRQNYSDVTLQSVIEGLSPDLIVCSGWIDQGYLRICRSFHPSVKTVLALDNQLPNTLRGWASLLRARYVYRKWFRFAWVPGEPQMAYAKRIGFGTTSIFSGFYTADVERFKCMRFAQPSQPFPKRFVFVGRYLRFKGIKELWEAYDPEEFQGWELWCAGQGALYERRKTGPGIHHLGFVQPDEMDTFVKQGGVFILPSHEEPWGVVVHEFAAAGYPLICSNRVGAATAFLIEGVNGFLVQAGDSKDLKAAMQKMSVQSAESLVEMARASGKLAGKITPESWVEKVTSMLETT